MQFIRFVSVTIILVLIQMAFANPPFRSDKKSLKRVARQNGFQWGNAADNNFNSMSSTTQSSTSTVAVPGMGTTRSACEDACQATSQFDPLCGTNGVTYTNIKWLRCAQRCGVNVTVQYPGSCPRTR